MKLEEGLSLRSAPALLFVFYVGYVGIHYGAVGAPADVPISMLLGLLMSAPMLLIFGRLTRLLPGRNLFEMLDYGFGRVISYGISGLYFIYFLILTSFVLGQIEFERIVSLPHTPLLVLCLLFLGVAAYFAHRGVLSMGKWSVLMIIIVVAIAVLLSLLSISNLRISNLLSLEFSRNEALLRGGYQFMVSPLGAGVVLLALLGRSTKWVSFYKVFFLGASLATLFFLWIFLRDLSVLGSAGMERLTYPAYHAASGIQVGAGGRVESLVTVWVLLSALTMLAVCLYAAAGGLRRMTGRQKNTGMLIPATVLALGFTAFLGMGFAEGFPLELTYLRYAPVVQGGIPVLLWLVMEIKMKRQSV